MTRPAVPARGFVPVAGVQGAAAEEEAILRFWREEQIFRRTVDERDDAEPFVFYEGPPTTNGRPGVHHVLSRTVKDLVCRFWTMEGRQVRRKGGWDTHGLPVEIEVEKLLGIDGKQQIEEYGIAKFNATCRESVFKYKDEWEQMTERIGFWLDLDRPYVTLDNDYIESVWWALKQFWNRGLGYAGFKVVPYCPRCQTALSDHEVSQGYKTVTDPSVFVKFALVDEPGTYVLAWTTTPWTMTGNVALAVGPDIDYLVVRQGDERFIVAKERAEILRGEYTVESTVKGSALAGRRYRPLFPGLDLQALTGKDAYYVAVADFVTTEDGTGVVHTAVMYGADDYTLGQQLDLPMHHTVDETGRFIEAVPGFAGRRVREVDPEIIDFLKQQGSLYKRKDYEHSYPFCWRCDSALLYYARSSWYLRTTAIKDRMIAENRTVRWFPKEVGESRFGNWLENNIDWAISRDRYWGTPLPLWVCDGCETVECMGSRQEIADRGGAVPDDLHRPYVDEITFACTACPGTMRRVPSVLDVWFDSGAMPFAQWHYPFENADRFDRLYPADFICEGIDQSRGWFYSLMAVGTLIQDRVPYRNVVSNGLILDDQGRLMSQRLGNIVDPWEILHREGADALRWYLVGSSPPWNATRFSMEGIAEVSRKFFGTLRNVATFFTTYANIDGWTPLADPPAVSERPVLDRWILSRLDGVASEMHAHLTEYQMTRAARLLNTFVQEELSNWYVRRNRRRFWKGEPGPDKDAAYSTLHEVLVTVSKLLAPYAPFLAETLHRSLSVPFQADVPSSVHLCRYPNPDAARRDPALEADMARALAITELGRAARTTAGLKVRVPLSRILVLDSDRKDMRAELAAIILDEINVKALEFAAGSAVESCSLKPNFKALGPRFGGGVNAVAAAIKPLPPDRVVAGLEAGSWTVYGEGQGDLVVGGDEVAVERSAAGGYTVAEDRGLRVALDTALTPELEREGQMRELLHRLQNLRKERGMEITDRVRVQVATTPGFAGALAAFREFMQDELLATDFRITGDGAAALAEAHATFALDGNAVSATCVAEREAS